MDIKDLTPLGIDRLMGFMEVYGGLVGFIVFQGGINTLTPLGIARLVGFIKGYGGFRVMEHRCLCWGFYVNLW